MKKSIRDQDLSGLSHRGANRKKESVPPPVHPQFLTIENQRGPLNSGAGPRNLQYHQMFKEQKARAMTQRQKFRLNLKIPDHDQIIGEDKTAEIRYMRDKLGSPNTNNMTITSAKGLAS